MDKQKYVTPTSVGKNQSPVMNYERQHHVDCVTKFLIDYLLEDKMTFKIYGNQELKRTKKAPTVKSGTQNNTVQVQSKSTRPMFTEKSVDNSKAAGANSTMNSSMSSQGSSNNYKIVGQTVSSVPVKQLI